MKNYDLQVERAKPRELYTAGSHSNFQNMGVQGKKNKKKHKKERKLLKQTLNK